jgi:type IV secretory pathway VirB10-like protein
MSSTRLHIHPAAPHLPPARPAQASTSESAHRDQRLRMAVVVVAVAGALLTVVSLAQQPSKSGQETPPPPSRVVAAAPSAADVAAARNEACDAWEAAFAAIVTTRQPFVEKTQPGLVFDWNDPRIMLTLAQAQAGILAQLEYLRGHIAPATPREVAGPVRDFIAATSDVIAADGQHQPVTLTNAAAERFNTAVARIRAACGG